MRIQKETDLQGVFSEDFGPGVEGWFWWLSDRPELSERMMDEGDGGFFSGSDVPALAEKVDLVVGVDASFQDGAPDGGPAGWLADRDVWRCVFPARAFSQAAFGLKPVVRQTVAFWCWSSRSSTI